MIPKLSAVEMAAQIRKKKLSAREVLDAHIQQIERVNPMVNAIVTQVLDQARADAKRADEEAAQGNFRGVLHGLPIAHKDLQETKGIRTTYGSPIFKDNIPTFSASVVERLARAGTILVGKTNTPEFGAGSQTFNPVFGATRNPHDLSRTCGGSSGGAAVALATGMLPIADGSDMGGSLRNPAAFCGVVGMRPSPGRVPQWPSRSAWSPLSVSGPMARSVADLALLFSAMAGPDERSPLSIHEPGERFAQPLGRRSFKGVRVGWFQDLGGNPFDPLVRDAVNAQRQVFEALGCIVEDAEPDFTGADEVFKVQRALSYYNAHAAKLADHRALLKATVVEEIERGARLTGPEIAMMEFQRSQLYARAAEFFLKYEYFILPTTQVLPFPVEQEFVSEINGAKLNSYIDWMRSCYYITALGHPAISVPAGMSNGLPVGLQIVGRHHADWAVLELAHAYEQAAPAARVWPKVAG